MIGRIVLFRQIYEETANYKNLYTNRKIPSADNPCFAGLAKLRDAYILDESVSLLQWPAITDNLWMVRIDSMTALTTLKKLHSGYDSLALPFGSADSFIQYTLLDFLLAHTRIVLTGLPDHSPTAFAKLLCPVIKLLQAFFAHAGSDVDQTSFKVCEPDRSDLLRRHVK